MSAALHVVEVCAGAGGQALGLHRAGFHHRVALEYDPDAAATLSHNLSRLTPTESDAAVAVGDVTDPSVWTPEDYVGVDLLAGGPPCPPFSDAGHRLGASDERDLYAFCIDLVARIRPRAALIENVAGLSRPRFAGYRQAVTDRLTNLGYRPRWRIIHASHHGVAQTRPRFILVAVRHEEARYFRWPAEVPTTDSVGSVLAGQMAAAGWRGADEWIEQAVGLAPTIVGGSRKHGGPDLGPTGSRRRWAALRVDGRSIANEPPSASFAPDGMPRLTAAMTAALQGFPVSEEGGWEFLGTKTARCRQIGNAFPPTVAEALGRSIAAALRREVLPVAASEDPDPVQCPVFSTLAQQPGRFVSSAALSERGLSDREIRSAVGHLRRDFDIEIRVRADGGTSYRLDGWRSTSGGHDRYLPLGAGRARRAA